VRGIVAPSRVTYPANGRTGTTMSQSVVYTCGTFDLFHIGHLRMIENARALGDRLVVAVSTDELVESYKGIRPTVPFEERIEIVRSIRGVDLAIPQRSQDKVEAWERIGFNVWVVGDDWFESDKYQTYRTQLSERGVHCVFLPYTAGVSSTQRRVASAS
jgi:glycerol-3-phosphate cytidylyltransferase